MRTMTLTTAFSKRSKTGCKGLFAAVSVSVFFLQGCLGLTGGAGSKPEGYRLVEGQLILPASGIVGRQVTGLQVAAVSVRNSDGVLSPDVFVSSVFNPAQRTQLSSFVVAVDGTKAFHILLQVPASGIGPGRYLGRLQFSDGRGGETSLIPAAETDIVLGDVSAVENDPETAADNVLRIDSGTNPLAQSDSDLDTRSDLQDDDDDEDGVPDSSDEDVAGDGVADVEQALEALADSDGDGIPDAFQP